MPRILDHVRSRIVLLHGDGESADDIRKSLDKDGYTHSLSGVKDVIRRYDETGLISDAPRLPPSILDDEDLAFIHERMLLDDETTAKDLQNIFLAETGRTISISTLCRARRKLGWIATGPRYCQLIRYTNMIKRLEYAASCISSNEQFEDVIFTDECSVQLDHHATVCFRFVDPVTGYAQPRQMKPRAKHPVKVHIWAGISSRGATQIQIFDGIMEQLYYQSILQTTLKPFIASIFPDGHRFMQDNDPKHTSKQTVDYLTKNGINWWRTPPESPDLNPIEQLWHEMKHFLRKTHKPYTKEELENGIRLFWEERVTVEKCQKYISNLPKALVKVIEVGGQATGY